MQVQRRLGFCFALLITLTTNALASCPRMLQGPPCAEYWRADAVFMGVASYLRTSVSKSEQLRSLVAGACRSIFLHGARYELRELY